MKKIYLVILCLVLSGIVNFSYAQKRKIGKSLQFSHPKINVSNAQKTGAAGCDTLNYPVPEDWKFANYISTDQNGNEVGFVTGTNGFDDKQKAQYFDASATTNTYLTRAWVAFSFASSPTPSKEVPLNIYDASGSGGSPGALLGTSTVTLSKIIDNVNAVNYTDFVFSPAISLPANKKFFVSVDISNLDFDGGDSVSVASTSDETGVGGTWEQWENDTWNSFPSIYAGTDLTLIIHPFLSTNQTCSLLPVNIISFNAQKKNKDVELNWLVAQEKDMDYYEVERAVDMLKFVSVGKVPANNSPMVHSYSFVDRNAASTGKLFYRLRKVDKDGSYLYSNILNFNSQSVSSIKVATFTGNTIPVFINSVSTQKVSATLYDLQGRVIAKNKEQMLVAGSNNINVQVNTVTRNGIYILSLFIDGVKHNYKIFKQ